VVVELDDGGELGGADGIWSEAVPAGCGCGRVDRRGSEGPPPCSSFSTTQALSFWIGMERMRDRGKVVWERGKEEE
jgi:hypothetical protein